MLYLVIRPDTDDLEVDVRHGDKLRAEREMLARGLGTPKDAPMSWLSIAVWRGALRAGANVPDDFDAFVDTIEDIQQAGADAAPFPTERTAGD